MQLCQWEWPGHHHKQWVARSVLWWTGDAHCCQYRCAGGGRSWSGGKTGRKWDGWRADQAQEASGSVTMVLVESASFPCLIQFHRSTWTCGSKLTHHDFWGLLWSKGTNDPLPWGGFSMPAPQQYTVDTVLVQLHCQTELSRIGLLTSYSFLSLLALIGWPYFPWSHLDSLTSRFSFISEAANYNLACKE